MLEENQNIDEIIRGGLEHYAPEVPADAWQGISQQMHGGVQAGAASKGALHTFGQMGLVSKIVLLAAIPVIAVTGYFVLRSDESKAPETLAVVAQLPNEVQKPVEESVNKPLPGTSEAQSKSAGESKSGSASGKQTAKEGNVSTPVLAEPNQALGSAQKLENQGGVITPETVKQPVSSKGNSKNSKDIPLIIHNEPNAGTDAKTASIHSEPEFGNVFSPNGDGRNDTWEIVMDETVSYHLRIFNSKQQLVFETDQQGNFWNGTDMRSGMDCESGSYAYIIDYQFSNNEASIKKTGFINLLR